MKAVFLGLLITITTMLSMGSLAEVITQAEFETIVHSPSTHWDKWRGDYIIEIYDNEEWSAFWDQHSRGEDPLPEIDFKTSFVVAAIDTRRSGGGNEFEINSIELSSMRKDKLYRIELKSARIGSSYGALTYMSRPIHIVKVEK